MEGFLYYLGFWICLCVFIVKHKRRGENLDWSDVIGYLIYSLFWPILVLVIMMDWVTDQFV